MEHEAGLIPYRKGLPVKLALRPPLRRAALPTAVVALLLSFFALAPSAGAQSVQPAQAGAPAAVSIPDSEPEAMCETAGGGEADCWQLNGSAVDDESALPPLTALSESPANGPCDTVTSGCPFADPTLANALIGHSIVEFSIIGTSNCADSNSGLLMIASSCSGSHSWYVPVDNGLQFISVGASNFQFTTNGVRYPSDVSYIAALAGAQVQFAPAGRTLNYNWEQVLVG
jgi:hypothetical protein